MKVITSWDDGAREDEKLVELLLAYELPAIFFIPIVSWGFHNTHIYNGFEFGGHTYSHPADLKECDDERLNTEIDLAKKMLEEKVGKKTEWFCYPRGRYDHRVMNAVRRAGFKKARTTKIGFHDKLDYEVVSPLQLRGYHCFNRTEYRGLSWDTAILEMLAVAKKSHAVEFHIWGHSWEIEKYNEWQKLENLFKQLKEKKWA